MLNKSNRVLGSLLSLSLITTACVESGSLEEAENAAEGDLRVGWIPGPDGYIKVSYDLNADGVPVMEGDMRIEDVLDAPPKEGYRAAYLFAGVWKGGVVPYEIGGGFDAARTKQIHAAIADWNTNTPFWFTPRNGQADYVRFVNSDRCESAIGRKGGMQDILLGTGCGTAETIHEMGHAVGFFHEQSRQDRDNFINIDYSNVKDGKKGNFDKYLSTSGEDWGPYEVESIMHYPAVITDSEFVKDTSKATITRKDGTTYSTSSILTGLDRAAAYKKADFSEPLKDKWLANRSVLGFALNSPRFTADNLGRYLPTESGRVYVHLLKPDPVMVHGLIYQKYLAIGAEASFYGRPLTDELTTPDGVGRYNHFEGGSIYWTPATGAQLVHGLIREKWAELGWELGFLGYPVTDELPTPDGVGRYNHFQGGSIYWSPNTGAHEVHGLIRDKWAEIGWELSFYGYPLTDELVTPNGVGRYNHFQGGSIYWSPNTGAHLVYGLIRDKWAELGWENGALGFPMTDELPSGNGGRFNEFQGGWVHWHPNHGTWVVWK